MIYYLMTADEWEFAKEEEEYWPPNFDDLGYIPCADHGQTDQLIKQLNLDNTELIKLTIDTDKLESLIIYEDVYESGFMYPHVYGYINIDAVILTNHYQSSVRVAE